MTARRIAAALALATALAAGPAGASVFKADESLCKKVQAEFDEGNRVIGQVTGITDADPQIALLRQVYINSLMVRQASALSLLQWYNCQISGASVLPPLPSLNIDAYSSQAEAAADKAQATLLSERRLKQNRTRILDNMRDIASINAMPAACAGSAAFATADMQELFDALYQAGYGTEDVYYFQSQYERNFADALAAARESIKRAGFEIICNRDMADETRKAFEKIQDIRAMIR